MSVELRDVTYEFEGRRLKGVLADGSNGRRVPGILVAHEGRGFTQHPRDRARMLAELGYVAYAPDYFGERIHSVDHAFTFMNRFIAAPRQYAGQGRAALRVLQDHPGVDSRRLAAIGFCWGAYAALKLACEEPLRCVVGFHPGVSLGPLGNTSELSAKVLICVGDQDPHVPKKDYERFLAEMAAAHVDCQMLLLVGVQHSFTNPEADAITDAEGLRYDAVADRRAWMAMRALFAEALDPPPRGNDACPSFPSMA
jgi:dienelactone hydrolase